MTHGDGILGSVGTPAPQYLLCVPLLPGTPGAKEQGDMGGPCGDVVSWGHWGDLRRMGAVWGMGYAGHTWWHLGTGARMGCVPPVPNTSTLGSMGAPPAQAGPCLPHPAWLP